MPTGRASDLGVSAVSIAARLAGAGEAIAPESRASGRRPQDLERAGQDPRLEPARRLVVAVDLDRLGGLRLHADLTDRAADDPAVQLVLAEQQRRRPTQAVDRVLRPEDHELQAAVGRVDGASRADLSGHDVTGVGDQDEVAADLELLPIGRD